MADDSFWGKIGDIVVDNAQAYAGDYLKTLVNQGNSKPAATPTPVPVQNTQASQSKIVLYIAIAVCVIGGAFMLSGRKKKS